MEKSLAKSKREARQKPYDPKSFIARIDTLMTEKNLSMRHVSLESGLDHQAVRRIKEGNRPDMTYCILLADYFDINPNELLQLANWPALKAFDIRRVNAATLPPEAVDVALDIAKIPDPRIRKSVSSAVRVLLKKHFT